MFGVSRASAALSCSLVSVVLVSCGAKSAAESEVNTIVGRGGTLFDKRVQVINALPNLAAGTTCLYVSEYNRLKAPVFSGEAALSSEQQDFLRRAERDARPVTHYPVSMAELDRGLAEKDVERRMRGILLIPAGITAAYLGFFPIALGLAWGASFGAIISNPFSYPFIFGMFGGLGMLNQSSRDLNSKNNGLRAIDATANASSAPSRSHLGVTLAFINVAKSLPAASNLACPANLTSEAVQPYFSSVMESYNAMSDVERSSASQKALDQLKNSDGCHFSASVGDETLVYQALPLKDDRSSVRLQTYAVKPSVGAQLISDEELTLQMSSDAGAGAKYVADNTRGSIAIWLSAAGNGAPVEAKLAHKLPSGAYVGNKTHIQGTCRL